jgi:NhaP-type Na+/H+ or K+/H+ antiporter
MLVAGFIRVINVGKFGASIYAWKNMDADLILYIFLPPLIFGEAMSLNW